MALLGLWAWLGYGGVVPGYMLPKPHELLDTIGHYVFGDAGGPGSVSGFGVTGGLGHAGRFLPDLLASLARAGAGFAWAAALGLPLGVLSGRLPGPRRALSPLINAIRAVPGISWLPLALVWFGIGLTTTIFLIGLAAFFPIYLGTVAGVAGAPPVLERAGAMLGLSRIGVLARVVLPAGMGHVVTGLRLGLGASFAYLVLGELTGVPDGLGARIMDARMSGRVDVIMAGMLAIALTGFLADRLLVRVLGLLVPGARAPRPDRTASRPSGRPVSPNKPSSDTLALTRPAPDPRPERLAAALDADPADSPDSRVHGAALSIRGLTVCHAADCPDRLHPSAAPPYADAPDLADPERALAETGQDRPRPADQADPAVLRDLSLDADPGQIVAILGQSGCGKTTLLDAVAGFTRPLRGHIRLDGRESIGPSPQKAVVFQEDALFPWLSALDNAAFGLAARGLGRRERRQAARTMLDRLGLGGAGDMAPSALSGGMRQRVALARVLLLEPRLLLMDEPFAALDAFTREDMQDLLLDLCRRYRPTVLFVTHDVSEAARLADRVVILSRETRGVAAEERLAPDRSRQPDDPEFARVLGRLRTLLGRARGADSQY